MMDLVFGILFLVMAINFTIEYRRAGLKDALATLFATILSVVIAVFAIQYFFSG